MDHNFFTIYLDKSKEELKKEVSKLKQDYIRANLSVDSIYRQRGRHDMEDVLYRDNRKSLLETAEAALRKKEFDEKYGYVNDYILDVQKELQNIINEIDNEEKITCLEGVVGLLTKFNKVQ